MEFIWKRITFQIIYDLFFPVHLSTRQRVLFSIEILFKMEENEEINENSVKLVDMDNMDLQKEINL